MAIKENKGRNIDKLIFLNTFVIKEKCLRKLTKIIELGKLRSSGREEKDSIIIYIRKMVCRERVRWSRRVFHPSYSSVANELIAAR